MRNVFNVAFAIQLFAGRMGSGLMLNPCSIKNSIVRNISGSLEKFRNFKNILITFTKKTLTSLKYYKVLLV